MVRITAIALAIAVMVVAQSAPVGTRAAWAATAWAQEQPSLPDQRILVGWFNVAYGGPLVQLSLFVEDEERTVDLLIDDELLSSVGGAPALDRRRVQVTAVPVDDSPEMVRVTSIALLP